MPRQLSYRPGTRAVVTYIAERRWDDWIAEHEFAIEINADQGERVFSYPDDPYLPGLQPAASASDAHDLFVRHLATRPHQLRVRPVRYRPGKRAVLRHTARTRKGGLKLTLFARVLAPERVDRLLAAGELAHRAGVSVPRLAGTWPEGGVVWVSKVPGKTVRKLIRRRTPPAPALILDLLERVWSASVPTDDAHALNLKGGFRSTNRLLSQVLVSDESRQALEEITGALDGFVNSWKPTGVAHNDFYDDQLIRTPEGHLTLVDFEEIGLGDPLIDVANFLSHLRWAAHSRKASEHISRYADEFRSAVLQRFGWSDGDLALREAYALFLISTNPVRHLSRNLEHATRSGLELAARALDLAA